MGSFPCAAHLALVQVASRSGVVWSEVVLEFTQKLYPSGARPVEAMLDTRQRGDRESFIASRMR
jgi:hypothetical protein